MQALRIAVRFVRDERGLETVEYAIMLALISAAVLVAVAAIAEFVRGRFDYVVSNLSQQGS